MPLYALYFLGALSSLNYGDPLVLGTERWSGSNPAG